MRLLRRCCLSEVAGWPGGRYGELTEETQASWTLGSSADPNLGLIVSANLKGFVIHCIFFIIVTDLDSRLTCHGLNVDVQEVLNILLGLAPGEPLHHLRAAPAELLQSLTEHREAGLCLQVSQEERGLPLVHAVFEQVTGDTGLIVTALSPHPHHECH